MPATSDEHAPKLQGTVEIEWYAWETTEIPHTHTRTRMMTAALNSRMAEAS